MKPNFLVLLVFLSLSFFSCKKDVSVAVAKSQVATEAILTGGQSDGEKSILPQPIYPIWRVAQMTYDKNDQTYHFKGFRFEFRLDHTVVATNLFYLVTVYGKWYFPDPQHLVMYFDTSTPDSGKFELLNGEWLILKHTDNGALLESNENNIIRELIFERIF